MSNNPYYQQHNWGPPQGGPPPRADTYAPPAGPPPGQHSDYAPPSGPPPGHHPNYAPPSGPPPGHSSDYAPPSGPPPGYGSQQSYAPPSGPPPGHSHHAEYAPPPGPPPGRSHQVDYAPPTGPPPNKSSQVDYAAPSGPPPGQLHQGDYAPPSGPPPSHGDYAPPPGPPPPPSNQKDWTAPPPDPSQAQSHDWQSAVPDTSLFPPPPAIFSGFYQSPTSNATEDEAAAGKDWCDKYPLTQPMTLDGPGRAALETGNIRLITPAGFNGKLAWRQPGIWDGSTAKNSPDRCIIGYPPLYVVNNHDPTRTGVTKTIYYEVTISRRSPANTIALGYTALPYPSFRMPGWNRGSLAVHGDDGHKYINDCYGGKDFEQEFQRGETIGLGMVFKPDPSGGARPQVEVFLTRNGRRTSGWDVHEEIDLEEDGPVTGLEGFHDLSCAIGTYDGLEFEAVFDPRQWKYKEAKA